MIKNSDIFVHCPKDGWCISGLFCQSITEIFIPSQKSISKKCILIMDMAHAHISKDSLNFLKEKEINYVLIPAIWYANANPWIWLLIKYLKII